MKTFKPTYIKTFQTGMLAEKRTTALAQLSCCTLCPHQCGVDRLAGETGICKTGRLARVSSFTPHFGEELPLVGDSGSGTIFFTHCNLLCNFCQNFDISHEGIGQDVDDGGLAGIMLQLQEKGCKNINFVTPSHVVPQIIAALEIAVQEGLRVPLVFNTGGYDTVETLQLLKGIIDIYMPDVKFMDPAIAEKICQVKDYPDIVKRALKEMHDQVGDLRMSEDGIAEKGLLVRHLVLPNGLANTSEVMTFIAEELSEHTYVNIMPQYRPCGRAYEIDALTRSIREEEYENALKMAKEAGIHRFDERRRVFALW